MALKDAVNRANPQAVADELRKLEFGTVLRAQVPQCLYKAAPAASSAQLATLQAFVLPNNGKAVTILSAYGRAGGVTSGYLTIKDNGVTPGSGEIAVAPNGDIVVLAADAWTNVDIVYIPQMGEEITISLPVVSNDLTIPATYVSQGVLKLVSATSTAGTLTGALIVLADSASAPATTKALLDLGHAKVKFAVADAVTAATVVLSLAPASGGTAVLLDAAETFG